MATEHVKPGDAVGRVSAEVIMPYPPGIPAADASLDSFRVVAR